MKMPNVFIFAKTVNELLDAKKTNHRSEATVLILLGLSLPEQAARLTGLPRHCISHRTAGSTTNHALDVRNEFRVGCGSLD